MSSPTRQALSTRTRSSNTSGAPLEYLSISTMEEPQTCEYPDSGKFMAAGSLGCATAFEVIAQLGRNAGYWDGEP